MRRQPGHAGFEACVGIWSTWKAVVEHSVDFQALVQREVPEDPSVVVSTARPGRRERVEMQMHTQPEPRAGCAPHSPVGALRLRPLLSEEHGSSPLPRLMVFSPAEATAQRTALGASVQEETGDRLAGLVLGAGSSRPLQGSRRWLSPCCGAPLACVLWSIPSPLQLGPPETLGRGTQAILAENPAQTNRVRERIRLQCVAGSCFASDALSLPVPGPQPPTLTIFLTSCPGSWGLGFSRLLPGVPWPLRLRQHLELSSEG